MRSEREVFADLAALCTSPGYVHALAFLAFRDNYIRYSDELKAEDMMHLFSPERLLRTEMATLVGLAMRGAIRFDLPQPNVVQEYVDQTDALLAEIHHAMFGGSSSDDATAAAGMDREAPSLMREVIFYSGESAYVFQYRDMCVKKYAEDEEWLTKNKGFTIIEARSVFSAVKEIQIRKLSERLGSLKSMPMEHWSLLPAFLFTASEVSELSGVSAMHVESVLSAFTAPVDETNPTFRSLHDFNVANSTPLLRSPNNEFLLFSPYSLGEAIYDSPFYWMNLDTSYLSTAMAHRGRYTEEFCADRLAVVFGERHVYKNVRIIGTKEKDLGEIDVLVIFGDRAIILQAKSKRLTLEARRGNDRIIKDDFRKSVQEAYDQGFMCAELFSDPSLRFVEQARGEIAIPRHAKEIYIICAVSDNYPALHFQARQFLTVKHASIILPPLVTDVFGIDVMTEMLGSPLRFLSYLNRRAQYDDKLMARDEITILSFHLKKNLWIDEKKYDLVVMTDDITADLDVAMSVRRDNVVGKRTPDGILTRLADSAFERLIQEIESRAEPATIELGMMLLRLSEDAAIKVSGAIELTTERSRRDGKPHDFVLPISEGSTGFIVHSNFDSHPVAVAQLRGHCLDRKYVSRADTWYGICLAPTDAAIRFGVNLDFEWTYDAGMEHRTRHMATPVDVDVPHTARSKKNKIGRNDPCPCGSGKKYKRCHGE
ncbi:MAG: SEC-C metal-binding domain-containing protein [Candidatus Acidiferrales bacterium]